MVMAFLRRLYQVGSRVLRRLFRQRVDSTTLELVEQLRAVPELSRLSRGALHAMAEASHRRSYRRGESLYYQGDPGLGLYLVESGRVRLLSDTEPGRPRELRELGANEIFGVLSLLGDYRRLETAETMTETRVIGFFRPDLKNVMRRNPKAGGEIAMALARRVAGEQVALLKRLEEAEGRPAALDLYTEAVEGTGVEETTPRA